jgi:hypothetical protein
MRENISSTRGVISSTIPAMLKSSFRRPFSRHALRVQQHAPIISEKLRNFRLPDGCFFQLALPLTVFPHVRFHMIVGFGWASQKNRSAGARGGQISGTGEQGIC